MLYKLLSAVLGFESGSQCRVCGESIHPKDEFGVAEGVCEPCRG